MSTNNGCTVCEGGNQFILFNTNNGNVPKGEQQSAEPTAPFVEVEPVEQAEPADPPVPVAVQVARRIDEELTYLIHCLRDTGRVGKELLAPYAAAFEEQHATKMTDIEFNAKYGTNISNSTYYKWMTSLFYGEKEAEDLFDNIKFYKLMLKL